MYVFFACVTACTLLLFNGALVSSVFDWYAPEDSIFQKDVKFKQVATLILPVAMVLMEYWLYDFVIDRLTALEDVSDQELLKQEG